MNKNNSLFLLSLLDEDEGFQSFNVSNSDETLEWYGEILDIKSNILHITCDKEYDNKQYLSLLNYCKQHNLSHFIDDSDDEVCYCDIPLELTTII